MASGIPVFELAGEAIQGVSKEDRKPQGSRVHETWKIH